MHPAPRHPADLAEQSCIDGLGFGLLRLAVETVLGEDQLRAAGNNSIEPLLTRRDGGLIMARRRLLERNRAGSLALHLDQDMWRPRGVERFRRGIIRTRQHIVVHNGFAFVISGAYSRPHSTVAVRNISHHLRPERTER